ncbi:MAG: hypothetical protein GY705_13160, partial [Bacteroidetes bacterium]|nr:hypothetical protein [Bacteroidota bacterium]
MVPPIVQTRLKWHLYALSLASIFFFNIPDKGYSNEPCTAYTYDFGQGLLDTVPCGNGANTTSNIDIDAAGISTFDFNEQCFSVLAAPNDYVAWFTFIIQEGGSSFEWQLIETGGDDVVYEIYYSNDPGGLNECTDLTFYECGDDFVSWALLGVPNPDIPTRYYVAIYTQYPDNDVDINLKFRKACGETCINSDINATAGEDVCASAGESVPLLVYGSGGGGGPYTYLWSPNNGSISEINVQNPVVSPTETTTYTVSAVGVDGCSAFDDVTVYVDDPAQCPDCHFTLECPGDYYGCPGDDISPETIGSAVFTPSNAGACSHLSLSYYDEELSPGACVGALRLERIWIIVDVNTSAIVEECSQIITLDPDPVIVFENANFPGVENGATIEIDCNSGIILDMDDINISDICGQEVTVGFSEILVSSGNCLTAGYFQHMICTWTATDECGNTSQFSLNVLMIDNTPPVFGWIPPKLFVNCDAIPDPNEPTAIDHCDQEVDIGLSEEITQGDCTEKYSILREWTATDNCGNTSTIRQIIYVDDTTPPILFVDGEAMTLQCGETAPMPIVTASDNCDDEVDIAFGETTEDLDCGYNLVRTWTATDNCGNEASTSQSIHFTDDEAPIYTGNLPVSVTVECDQIPDSGTPIFSDNCDDNLDVDFVESVLDGDDCPQEYTILRSWFAMDDCGNTTCYCQTINVTDTTPPVIYGVTPTTVTGECNVSVPMPNVTVTDNCDGDDTLTYSETTTGTGCAATLIRRWTAVDDCGNTSTATQTIQLSDGTAPV